MPEEACKYSGMYVRRPSMTNSTHRYTPLKQPPGSFLPRNAGKLCTSVYPSKDPNDPLPCPPARWFCARDFLCPPLPPRCLNKAEVIIVGDVHGCHGEMVSLLKRCGYRLGNRDDRERFSVVLAGDLVNKGPGNADVVRTAREEGFLAVRGNHDNFALAAATGAGRFSKSLASEERGGGGAKPPPWVKELSRCA